MASDGSSLLTLDASSIQTAPDGYRTIVWMIKWMIKAHPTQDRQGDQPGVDGNRVLTSIARLVRRIQRGQ
jgi:hypothetical protein